MNFVNRHICGCWYALYLQQIHFLLIPVLSIPDDVEDKPATFDAFTKVTCKPASAVLTSFSADCAQNNVSVKWTVTNQQNTQIYIVEKSADSLTWVATGNALQADTAQSNYSYSESYSSAKYYRLRITGNDNTLTYSSAIKINCSNVSNSIQFHPVPANDLLNIVIQSDQKVTMDLIITDMSGRVINRLKKEIQTGTNNCPVSTRYLPNGQYLLKTGSPLNLKTQKIIFVH